MFNGFCCFYGVSFIYTYSTFICNDNIYTCRCTPQFPTSSCAATPKKTKKTPRQNSSEIHLQLKKSVGSKQESLKTVLEMRAKLFQQMLSLEDPWLQRENVSLFFFYMSESCQTCFFLFRAFWRDPQKMAEQEIYS